MTIRQKLATLLATFALTFAGAANAAILNYNILIESDNWQSNGILPFNLTTQPTITGFVSVDNTVTGIAAIQNFSLNVGNRTFTMAEFTGPTAVVNYNAWGDLYQFSLADFEADGYRMVLYRFNTFAVARNSNFIYCNSCVTMEQTTVAVPEPLTTALLGIGILGFGLARRRK